MNQSNNQKIDQTISQYTTQSNFSETTNRCEDE